VNRQLQIFLTAGSLAGMTQLQHLELVRYSIAGGSAGAAQLLSNLQHLQQLTYLDLTHTLRSQESNPPAEAYSAVTASSMLQHLNISCGRLPAGVWQNLFAAGQQLPNLRRLDVSRVCHPPSLVNAAPPGGDLLASCCPNLQVRKFCWKQAVQVLINLRQCC
jgi:hypothetical protein